MGRVYEAIDGRLADFIRAQPVFFVATAPLAADGHVNCSPKGNRGDLVILDERRVAYQDLTGSGVETIAHLRENGRILLMFCAFEGPPRIVRLHGVGQVTTPGEPAFDEIVRLLPSRAATRALVSVDVRRISDSCGYGVPLMDFTAHRDNMDHWAETKGADGIITYQSEHNEVSLDGLPGLTRCRPRRA
jgi:hypothetical protein